MAKRLKNRWNYKPTGTSMNKVCRFPNRSWQVAWRRALTTLLLALLLPSPVLAELYPYEARYSIYRDGKLSGKAELELTVRGDRWEIRSEGSGTHGLARILRARDNEETAGRIVDGRYVPDRYSRHTRVAGIDDRWVNEFDWEADQVTVTHDGKKTWLLPLSGRALDPLGLKLEMRRRLSDPEPDLKFLMVDEEEIDEENFRVLETEWLETSLGCLETVPVEKIRRSSKRYTRAWHAPAFGFVEVKVEHGKTGGVHLEMRIAELNLGGTPIMPRAGCSAMQAADNPIGEVP